MNQGKTSIIPIEKTTAKVQGAHELNLKAICVFMATGFFLDSDTYWKDEMVISPGTNYERDENGYLVGKKKWFEWHYTPRSIGFHEALEEFTALFESVMAEQTEGKKVILPLSGGLDSRTQAVALRNHPEVQAYSYSFKGGYPEHKIAKRIAEQCNFPFRSFLVEKGYLWEVIEELAKINQCQSEFTHPRQMAFKEELGSLGNLFSLGHMGDLMFDSFGYPQLDFEEEVAVLSKLLLKKGGVALAKELWKVWGLDGDFESYFRMRISELLEHFNIKDTNAKLRAFKTHFYVSRWSSNNLSIFSTIHPISLPYYDDRLCQFICTLPEEYLANRQLQIAYIQQNYPELARITWQQQRPFNLNNYHLNKVPFNLPYRVIKKLEREVNKLRGKNYISRNWELQFLGKENDQQLQKWLFSSNLSKLMPRTVIENYYKNFKESDSLEYSHPVSMLLTLALFQEVINK